MKKIGGDTGYSGTGNRDFCKENKIQTSFVKRGRPFGEKKKEKDLVRKELARVILGIKEFLLSEQYHCSSRIEKRYLYIEALILKP